MTFLNAQMFVFFPSQYCWKYFGESTTCGFKPCRFLHLPLEGDEKVSLNPHILFRYGSSSA